MFTKYLQISALLFAFGLIAGADIIPSAQAGVCENCFNKKQKCYSDCNAEYKKYKNNPPDWYLGLENCRSWCPKDYNRCIGIAVCK